MSLGTFELVTADPTFSLWVSSARVKVDKSFCELFGQSPSFSCETRDTGHLRSGMSGRTGACETGPFKLVDIGGRKS